MGGVVLALRSFEQPGLCRIHMEHFDSWTLDTTIGAYTSVAFGLRCKEADLWPSKGSVGDAYDCDLSDTSGWGGPTPFAIDPSVLALTCRPSQPGGISSWPPVPGELRRTPCFCRLRLKHEPVHQMGGTPPWDCTIHRHGFGNIACGTAGGCGSRGEN